MGVTVTSGAIAGLSASPVVADEMNLDSEEETEAKRILEDLRKVSNTKRKFANLTPHEKEVVLEALKPTDVSVDFPDLDDGSVSPLAGKRVTVEYTGTNTVSGDLWTYTAEVQWTYDGVEITSIERATAFGETHEVGWVYRDIENEDTIGGEGDYSFTYTTEGKFELCFQGCVQSATPVIEIDVDADGDWDADTKG